MRTFIGTVLVLACGAPAAQAQSGATAQGWAREAGAGVGVGHVFRFDDVTFGNVPNVAVSGALRGASGLGIEFEFNRNFGLAPAPAPCAIAGVTCVGEARDGILAAASASVSLQHEFGRGRIRPIITGGLAGLWTRSVWSTTRVSGRVATQTEEERSDAGVGPDLGAGLRFAITPRQYLGVDVRTLSGSALSAVNVAVTRVSTRWSYRW